jgi:hypothetical protein
MRLARLTLTSSPSSAPARRRGQPEKVARIEYFTVAGQRRPSQAIQQACGFSATLKGGASPSVSSERSDCPPRTGN